MCFMIWCFMISFNCLISFFIVYCFTWKVQNKTSCHKSQSFPVRILEIYDLLLSVIIAENSKYFDMVVELHQKTLDTFSKLIQKATDLNKNILYDRSVIIEAINNMNRNTNNNIPRNNKNLVTLPRIRVAKKWFLRGSAKIELKISCEDFYMLLLLNHHLLAQPSYSQQMFLFDF